MQCTLLVPHLFAPERFGDDICRGLALPVLRKFLSRAQHAKFDAIDATAWLCQAFEVERQLDWPVAPLTLAIDGGEPGDAYWLRADPVHLLTGRDQVQILDAPMLGISQQEADALTLALNRHFAEDGLFFAAPRPERWYLRPAQRPQILTRPPDPAAGVGINSLLPAGEHALQWHRTINEIQMLLHAHPLNQAREARGAPVINSLWLWGGGSKPAVAGRHFSAVWGGGALALALATSADMHAAALPDHAQDWLRAAAAAPAATSAHHLIVIDGPDAAARHNDAESWRSALCAFERNWLAPLLQLLRQRRVTHLALVATHARCSERFESGPLGMLRFWRPARPLCACAP